MFMFMWDELPYIILSAEASFEPLWRGRRLNRSDVIRGGHIAGTARRRSLHKSTRKEMNNFVKEGSK